MSVSVTLIFVGLMIVTQAVENSATRHTPALLVGIMILVCDWASLTHARFPLVSPPSSS